MIACWLFRESEESLLSTQRQYQRQVEDLQFSKDTLQRQKQTLESELSARQQECAGLKVSISDLTSAQAGIKAQLETTQVSTAVMQVFQQLPEFRQFGYN